MKNKSFVIKPWGNFTQYTLNTPSTVKIILVEKGQSTSLQFHKHRDEFWKVLKGEAILTIGNEIHQAKVGEEFFITAETIHRIEAGNTDVELLEISFGTFDEEDITRLKDNYGRIS
ncbi:MAG: phosphomannose isomerase type II C-terminal cupin domain [Candidatus Pacebacteria bacterium]|nr:phosphomannose isomerase type II C-terminal cupin domain [Candidatus Paceibacterota bacterium]